VLTVPAPPKHAPPLACFLPVAGNSRIVMSGARTANTALQAALVTPSATACQGKNDRGNNRALRPVKESSAKVEYAHLNPMRAGLVKRAEDWLWSSVPDNTGSLSDALSAHRMLSTDRALLPGDEKARN